MANGFMGAVLVNPSRPGEPPNIQLRRHNSIGVGYWKRAIVCLRHEEGCRALAGRSAWVSIMQVSPATAVSL